MKKVNSLQSSTVLLVVFAFITIVSISATYFKYVVLQDFFIDVTLSEE